MTENSSHKLYFYVSREINILRNVLKKLHWIFVTVWSSSTYSYICLKTLGRMQSNYNCRPWKVFLLYLSYMLFSFCLQQSPCYPLCWDVIIKHFQCTALIHIFLELEILKLSFFISFYTQDFIRLVLRIKYKYVL